MDRDRARAGLPVRGPGGRRAMTRATPFILLRVLTPLLGGVILGVILQAADPRVRIYLAASPGLVAAPAGLLGMAVAAGAVLAPRREATTAAAASARAP